LLSYSAFLSKKILSGTCSSVEIGVPGQRKVGNPCSRV